MLPRTWCRTCPPLGGPLFLLPQEYTNLWHRWLELWAVGRGLGDTRDIAISINSNTPVGQGPAGTLGQKPQSLSFSAHPWLGAGRHSPSCRPPLSEGPCALCSPRLDTLPCRLPPPVDSKVTCPSGLPLPILGKRASALRPCVSHSPPPISLHPPV